MHILYSVTTHTVNLNVIFNNINRKLVYYSIEVVLLIIAKGQHGKD